MTAFLEPTWAAPCQGVQGGDGAASASHPGAPPHPRHPPFDWYFQLPATDMPLVSVDDLAAALAGVPRDHSFLTLDPLKSEHSRAQLEWRLRDVVLDHMLYR
jgi:hypothetical protein